MRSSHSAQAINKKVRYTLAFKVMARYSHSYFQVQWRPKKQMFSNKPKPDAGARVALTDPLALQERQAC